MYINKIKVLPINFFEVIYQLKTQAHLHCMIFTDLMNIKLIINFHL